MVIDGCLRQVEWAPRAEPSRIDKRVPNPSVCAPHITPINYAKALFSSTSKLYKSKCHGAGSVGTIVRCCSDTLTLHIFWKAVIQTQTQWTPRKETTKKQIQLLVDVQGLCCQTKHVD